MKNRRHNKWSAVSRPWRLLLAVFVFSGTIISLCGPALALNPPTSLTATVLDSTRVYLTWTDTNTAPNETDYTLERCQGTKAACTSSFVVDDSWAGLAADSTGYIDTTACGVTVYSYRITAEGAPPGTSTVSVEVTTSAKGQTPASLTVSNVFEEQVELTWTYDDTDMTGFKVGRCEGVAPPGACNLDGQYGYTGSPYLTGTSHLPSGVVAYWKFDNPDWTGNGDVVTDSSGNGNHGTTVNGMTHLMSGKYGGAADFDGVSSYITTPVAIDQTSGFSGVTYEAWIYPTVNNSTYQHVISTDNGGYDWSIILRYGYWYIFSGRYYTSIAAATLNDWNHVAVVYDPDVGIRIYLDGTEYLRGLIDFDTSTTNVTLGRKGSSSYGYFLGSLDEVVIYDRPLTKTEVENRAQSKVSYTVNGLTPNQAVNFKMWPYKNTSCPWEGPLSAVASTATTDITALAPTLTSTDSSSTHVDLSWDDIASSETNYRLERCTGDPATTCSLANFDINKDWTQDLVADTTSFPDTTLCENATYLYRVRALGTDGGDSDWSELVQIDTVAAADPVMTVNVLSESEIDISWTDTYFDEEQFVLERCDAASWTAACDITPDATLDTLVTVPGNLLHYRMDEAEWNNGVNDVVDSSGNDNHGRPYGFLTTVAEGKYDRAADFKGVTHWLETPVNVDQSITSSGVTYEAWVKPTSTGGHLFYSGSGNWGIRLSSSNWYVYDGYGSTMMTGADIGNWQHVAAVFTPGSGIKFYLNGTEFSTTNIYPDLDDRSVVMGAYTSPFLEGYVDEVLIYDRPLTLAQITDHYNNKVNRTDYSDTDLPKETFYTYRIRAKKESPSCPWIKEDIVTVQTIVPPKPTGLTADATTSDVTLEWTDTTGSETGFRIQRCMGNLATCTPAYFDANIDADWLLGAETETYVDVGTATKVCPTQNVTYRVRAERNIATTYQSAWSDYISIEPVPSPQIPVLTSVTKVWEDQLELAWTDNNSDESGFTIERCDSASWTAACDTNPDQTYTVGAGVISYQNSGLVPGADYSYRVRADKATNNCTGYWQAADYSNVLSQATIPSVPADLATATIDTSTIDLIWTENTLTETRFQIWRCDSATWTVACDITPDEIFYPSFGAESYTDTLACEGQDYTYKIMAEGQGLANDGGGCWAHKKKLTFGGAGFPTNTGVEVVIDRGLADFAGIQPDFADIRFFDATLKRELRDYWIREINGNVATVWLKTGDNDNIYLYYENPLATDASSTDEPFIEVYDDFDNPAHDGNVPDPSKWVEIDIGAYPDLIKQENGFLVLDMYYNARSFRSWSKALFSTRTFERAAGNYIYLKVRPTDTLRYGGYELFAWGDDDNTTDPDPGTSPNTIHGLEFYGSPNWAEAHFRTWEHAVAPTYNNLTDRYFNFHLPAYEIKIELKDAGAIYSIKGNLYTDWTILDETSTDFAVADDILRIAIFHYGALDMEIDWIKVRHATAQRSVGFGVEENVICANDFNVWESLLSTEVAGSADTNKAAPTGLAITIVSNEEIKLDWNDNTDDETGFVIERCNDSVFTGACDATPDFSDTVGPEINTYTDTSAPTATSLTYRLKAYKTTPAGCDWNSSYDTASAIVNSEDAPDNLVAAADNSFKITLTWDDMAVNEDGYEIELQDRNGNFNPVGTTGPGVSGTQNYTETCGLEPDTTYTFRVRSYRGSAKSTWATVVVTTPAWNPGDSTSICE